MCLPIPDARRASTSGIAEQHHELDGHDLPLLRVSIRNVHPEHVNMLRDWLRTVGGPRRDEALATLNEESCAHEQAFQIEGSNGPVLAYVMEISDLEQSRVAAATSVHPIDPDHKRVMIAAAPRRDVVLLVRRLRRDRCVLLPRAQPGDAHRVRPPRRRRLRQHRSVAPPHPHARAHAKRRRLRPRPAGRTPPALRSHRRHARRSSVMLDSADQNGRLPERIGASAPASRRDHQATSCRAHGTAVRPRRRKVGPHERRNVRPRGEDGHARAGGSGKSRPACDGDG